jgi:hypothetical protein
MGGAGSGANQNRVKRLETVFGLLLMQDLRAFCGGYREFSGNHGKLQHFILPGIYGLVNLL